MNKNILRRLKKMNNKALERIIYMRFNNNYISWMPSTSGYFCVGEEPYEVLNMVLEMCSAKLRKRILKIIHRFLKLTFENEMKAGFVMNLEAVLQNWSNQEVLDDIECILKEGSLIKNGETERHAGLLKVLISNAYRGNEVFWLEQYKKLGDSYGAVIFSGLLGLDLDCAFKHLGELVKNEEATSWIKLGLPTVRHMLGEDRFLSTFEKYRKILPEGFYKAAMHPVGK